MDVEWKRVLQQILKCCPADEISEWVVVGCRPGWSTVRILWALAGNFHSPTGLLALFQITLGNILWRFHFHSYHFLCLWRWNPIVEKFDTATVVVAGDLSTRVNRNDTCYVLEWSIWVEFSCCLPALIHSLVEEGATMQDNTDAPSQSFYKCHWLPGILLQDESTTY